jgi:hypothetical protein
MFCIGSTRERDMPRYYFDISDDDGFHPDEFGHELDNYEEARQQAQAIIPRIMEEELPDGESHLVVCDMRGETGRIIYRAELTYRGTRFPQATVPT